MDDTFFNNDESFQDVSNMTQDNANQHLTSNDIETLVDRVNKLHEDIANELGFDKPSEVDYAQIELWAKEIDILSKRIDNIPVSDITILRAKVAFYLSEIEQAHGDAVNLTTYKAKILQALQTEAFAVEIDDLQIRA